MISTQPSTRFKDEHVLYVDSGVATQDQVAESLKQTIYKADKILGYPTNCRYKVNLIVDKEGKYFGFGYIRVSDPKIYWMLVGRNPDGTERVEEYPDPDWTPPTSKPKTRQENLDSLTQKSWFELAEEEESFIQPKIKKALPPLVTIPGYPYEVEQMKHLIELEIEKGIPDPIIPDIGFFEISRAYASDPPSGMLKNRICSRNVPDWIPLQAFKAIFSSYVTDKTKKGTYYSGKKEITDTYPMVNFVEVKKGGKIVFITFDPATHDAIFSLLMTKKTKIVNPANPNQKTTLIFMHAYDNQK